MVSFKVQICSNPPENLRTSLRPILLVLYIMSWKQFLHKNDVENMNTLLGEFPSLLIDRRGGKCHHFIQDVMFSSYCRRYLNP